MEDAATKRNTDCVYFLASPLTCKKGSECEFRHSESARVNPRDCYYWLNGNCLNPGCPFRHPPLDGLKETVPDVAHPPSYPAVPTTKSNVPCYFYFNTHCIKGDQCPFMHDLVLVPAPKVPKAAPETTTGHPQENKASTGSDTGPASVEVPTNPPGDTSELKRQEHSKEVLQQPLAANASEEPSPSADAESSASECEEPAIKLSEEHAGEYTNGSPEVCEDQEGSEELVKQCDAPDEWWESSPGFDVLVDDGTEQLVYDVYEDDADYLLAQERESEMLQGHLLPYDFKGSAGYDHAGYPDAGYLYEHGGAYDSYERMESRYTPEYFHGVSEQSRERSLEPVSPHAKRKLSRRRHGRVDERDDMDLRNHLRKRRRMDSDSRKHHSSRARGNSRERPVRPVIAPYFHSGLSSDVGRDMLVSSLSEAESGLNDFHRRGWPVQSNRHVSSRNRERESRRTNRKPPPMHSSRISRGPASRRADFSQVKIAVASGPRISRGSASRKADSSQANTADATFSGPKTLAQIKEEKQIKGVNQIKEDKRGSKVAAGNSSDIHSDRHSKRPGKGDFAGPKPLNELLKGKKRSVSSGDHVNGLASNQEHLGPQVDNELHHHGYESDFIDDGDDYYDDDSLRRELAHILS